MKEIPFIPCTISMKREVRRWLYWILAIPLIYASYLLVLLTLPYLQLKPGVEFLKTKQFVYHLPWYRWSFYIHVFSSLVLVLSGFFQFNKTWLRKYPKMHRRTGMLYVVVVLVLSGPSGWIMSLYANGGVATQTSFLTLSSLWWFSTLMAYLTVRKHEYTSHIRWMMRSYALTLSAVTLRFYAYLFDFFKVQFDPITTYTILAYISWIPNLIIAELLLRKTRLLHFTTP